MQNKAIKQENKQSSSGYYGLRSRTPSYGRPAKYELISFFFFFFNHFCENFIKKTTKFTYIQMS